MLFRSLVLAAVFINAFASSATERISEYVKVVDFFLSDQEAYKSFRAHPTIRNIYEHVSEEYGLKFKQAIIDQYSYLQDFVPLFELNDQIGSPALQDYPLLGKFCPTTLRYIYFTGEILELFNLESDCKIVEIGCGYGGQCAIISRLVNFSCYELIDLDFVVPLMDKYLSDLQIKNVEPRSMELCGVCSEYDLFISNYGLSECDRDVQEEYIKKIVRRCKRGYITYNYIPGVTLDNHTTEDFCDILIENGINPKVRNETIETNGEAPNKVIYWGEGI